MKLLHYEPAVPNFGDDLNGTLWSALAPSLFEGEGVVDDRGEAFVGIGTIVGIDPGRRRCLHVFSSGAGYTAADGWAGLDVHYHCVRGPVTAQVLGLSADRALTDGAILAPLVDRFRFSAAVEGAGARNITAGGRTVVVPHYETIAFPGWDHAVRMAGFDLVDPRGAPEVVIAALASARLVLTESLHGAILADAYGVPWRGFAVSRNFSTAKWADWTGSLELNVEIALVPPPDPMPLLRFGKRGEAFGTMLQLEPEASFREFRSRIAPPARIPFLKAQAKRVLEDLPAARRLLGFSPQRTAKALAELATYEPYLSLAGRRDSLRDAMLQRLEALVRLHQGALARVT
ncbi:succinoglycan biosynthesis ketolase [Novosphingobium barchaimii LL02]|uniref:Succinoglycan biosynthesis ketolase n=1 Tax=Novosphingobium barchaimii LL02 TaxID=1114963 RepID=A0A0J8A644_9SPHN|nr:polysaccharide pyruvyl transferase family protein [Novosphingobium barchaimii]KMS50860.1 succinoglycan biosynthesis ketolase [Novosphingobium barchaimii LL02]